MLKTFLIIPLTLPELVADWLDSVGDGSDTDTVEIVESAGYALVTTETSYRRVNCIIEADRGYSLDNPVSFYDGRIRGEYGYRVDHAAGFSSIYILDGLYNPFGV